MHSGEHCIDLMEIAPGLCFQSFDTIERKLKPSSAHPLLSGLPDYNVCGSRVQAADIARNYIDKDLKIFSIDRESATLLVHLGAVKTVCELLGVMYPDERVGQLVTLTEQSSRDRGIAMKTERVVTQLRAERVEDSRKRILIYRRLLLDRMKTKMTSDFGEQVRAKMALALDEIELARLTLLESVITMESHFLRIEYGASQLAC